MALQLEEAEEDEHGNSVKIFTTCITRFTSFLDFISDIISFQHVPHFGVGINLSGN